MKIKDYFYTQENFVIEESLTYPGVLKTHGDNHCSIEDLEKYYESEKYLSHTKNTSLTSYIYQIIQKYNHKYKLQIIRKYKNSGKLLDYGCGDGAFIEFIKNKTSFQVFGIEPNQKANQLAKEKLGQNAIKSLDEIPNASMDIITLWHVLEHIPNPEEIISQLVRKLSPQGFLIIALPNFQSFDAHFYKNYWAAWDVPRHLYHYSKDGAINFMINNNLNVLYTYPLPFDSFFISMMSEKYKKNPLAVFRFPIIASLSNVKGMFNGNYSSLIYITNT